MVSRLIWKIDRRGGEPWRGFVSGASTRRVSAIAANGRERYEEKLREQPTTQPLVPSVGYKIALLAALVASASAFAPASQFSRTTALNSEGEKKLGSGGMADTRDPEAFEDEDPRKSISAAPSFEEYLKQREVGLVQ
ncbi:hypothetical protein THAOC_00386 [Thalassiosira oceanica]|uniref:Uncharacterized protein n=1 Tax=Thalassiosira oceanica TaxID=159749 RepID=K0TRG6_THAOC|nr:hypothetical protein THAOC_00386 [Thalassiosira oceanica]|eukprot:EJK77762.1 hypothetical protein THAOC_00386 [Thalassiosira oceanica]